jgi:mannose-6-phosphate isomerase-like protein (cupin superfamily)
MKGIYIKDIEKDTIKNKNYREIIGTCPNKGLQVALMSLLSKQEIGREMHTDADQFIRVEKGTGLAIINDNEKYDLKDGSVIIIPRNTYHNIINTGTTELKLYTVYTKAQHEDGLVEEFKDETETEEVMSDTTSDDTYTTELSDAEQIISMEETERMIESENEQTGGKRKVYRLKI